ncbi:hypothetical protein Dsin_019255 [Dipteronia sinensis]|uniref:SWIM-type domain-containing protein n=1 Tax=Dipteronia sinensis TaxID=43782 RepID=A0AAE0A7M7_9ROSI|nr:hypothetical protein Dsin_019255 [Dipteronia sinensis]
MYPVAYVLVESECKDTWTWFLEQLAVDLGINNYFGVVWISDKQKGLIDAIGDLFPNSEHRFFCQPFLQQFQKPTQRVTTKTDIVRFTQCMLRMRSESEVAYQWFVEKVKQESYFYYPVYSGNYKYQITSHREDQFVVDIDKKTCACKKWQLIGIPCIHGMATLLSSNCDSIDFKDN